jgi:hypothetical protein
MTFNRCYGTTQGPLNKGSVFSTRILVFARKVYTGFNETSTKGIPMIGKVLFHLVLTALTGGLWLVILGIRFLIK